VTNTSGGGTTELVESDVLDEVAALGGAVPWEAVPGQVTLDDRGERRVTDRPWRLAASYTLQGGQVWLPGALGRNAFGSANRAVTPPYTVGGSRRHSSGSVVSTILPGQV
jgi:hypothetical protein